MANSVIVVEDDHGLREQLVKILNSGSDIHCVAITGRQRFYRVRIQ